MTQVVMFLSNSFRPDPRVEREARALVKHGYRVTLICWDRKAEFVERESHDGIEIIRVQSVASTYGSGWRQIFYLPRFWHRAIHLALSLNPDIVHCHDLDTLYAGWQVKKRLGCSMIYDAHEHYPALMSLYLPTLFINALAQWERWLACHADTIITASTVLRDELIMRGVQSVVALGNYPNIASYAVATAAEIDALRSQLGVSSNDLLVAYIGGFSRNRRLLPLIEAAAQLSQVHFHLWGDGPQRTEVELAIARQPNVHYHGWLSPDKLPRYFCAADIIYYCLRLDYPGAIYNAPNTLSQAMAAGRPVIANDIGDLGRIVRQTGCGVLVPTVTPQEICRAVEKLHDPIIRRQLGEAGRAAAAARYSWETAEKQLIHVYSQFTKKR